MSAPRLGLALSGGGAAGFGHIVVLEALEELGLAPVAVAGTSAGAVVGACVAAGIPAHVLRDRVLDVGAAPFSSLREHLGRTAGWLQAMRGGIDPDLVVQMMLPDDVPERFEDLAIPLSVVTTDFHRRAQRTIAEGPLRPALAASVAIPGIFRPVTLDGRVLVDGGVTNNLPIEVLPEVDICLAVDVASEPPSEETDVPGTLASITGAMRIMMQALLERHVASRPDVLLVQPGSRVFGPLELHRADEILAAAEPARDEVKRKIAEALNRKERT